MPEHARKPGHALGPYPEREALFAGAVGRTAHEVAGFATRTFRPRRSQARRFLRQVNSAGVALRDLDARGLDGHATELRRQLHRYGLRPDLTAKAFALVREFADRCLGMRHFDCQIVGGWAILQGMLAEMDTGEGKTLTATLPAGVAAMAGIPVHVVTVNDYLAARDRELMAPLYALLGVRAGVVTADMRDPATRRSAYACDVTYCTNKQLAFDYLRDRVAIGDRRAPLYRRIDRLPGDERSPQPLLLRGLCFAIVDEADSVLIDEARTPLKLSGMVDDPMDARVYREATAIAGRLEAGVDYRVGNAADDVKLLEPGRERCAELAAGADSYFHSERRREAMIRQALIARELFVRDRHYLVSDGKVQIIDEHSGRTMPDRSWDMGLHQLIEAREGLDITPPVKTMARITYQRFFRRYLHLGAMTGTAREVADELWSVYDLPVFRVPTNRPSRRTPMPPTIHRSESDKWRDIVDRARAIRDSGRPVLIGTRSVGASEELSAELTRADVDHEVLNARQDQREAAIIARAGRARQVTVATNMAGRGTDIELGPGIADAGGLHVIAAEQNDARRIDRQLFGRCGRQGDSGSYEVVWSWDDAYFRKCAPHPVIWLAKNLTSGNFRLGRGLEMLVMRLVQIGTERRHARCRRRLLKQDQRLDEVFAFGGPME